jgi:hypothetical protein
MWTYLSVDEQNHLATFETNGAGEREAFLLHSERWPSSRSAPECGKASSGTCYDGPNGVRLQVGPSKDD